MLISPFDSEESIQRLQSAKVTGLSSILVFLFVFTYFMSLFLFFFYYFYCYYYYYFIIIIIIYLVFPIIIKQKRIKKVKQNRVIKKNRISKFRKRINTNNVGIIMRSIIHN
jgi:hypothetical protein